MTDEQFEMYINKTDNLKEGVDLLNELCRKNQDNEAMIEFLSTENTQIMNELKTRTQIQHQLEDENERLKSSDTITDLETEIMNLKTTIQQLRTDNTKQKKKLNTAMKENEELKCGNKNLKATLNDFINILNRLQSNPNNKQTLSVARDMLQNMGVDLE